MLPVIEPPSRCSACGEEPVARLAVSSRHVLADDLVPGPVVRELRCCVCRCGTWTLVLPGGTWRAPWR